jgi:predicted XRE-type DNA-binding protein
MTNKEKFLALVSEDAETGNRIKYREENSLWLRESKSIALKVLLALKERSMTQKDLAGLMSVSPQYVSKLVKGEENLTIDTITKLQEILGIGILVSSAQRYKNEFFPINIVSHVEG